MLHIALYQPEIPPNTGNIMRLVANMGFTLHLIEPLGFKLEEKSLRRAGLDYKDWANVIVHQDYAGLLARLPNARIFACSTHGRQNYAQVRYQAGDILLFGPETRGLPAKLRLALPPEQVIRIPMVAESRSLNLSNATAIIAYEAWRQLDFAGAVDTIRPA
ncbi:MAG: tRNA (cytidine(34)-2'-O)-methyltransferase [Gammaproteobacteria bacterium]|nr:tRNA (cytidine(34)-2'-O)-methyltransferase [Gammaproteobacteria bacterium]